MGAAPALALCVTIALALVQIASASHFRYGTISWIPVAGPRSDGSFTVEFTFRAAFRRNYEWGKWFREQWAVTSTTSDPSPSDWHGSEAYWLGPNVPYTCPGGSTPATNGQGCQNIDPQYTPRVSYFHVKFPYSVHDDKSIVTECPDPFYCDYKGPGGNVPSNCGSAVYGFFYGDGNAEDIIMLVDSIDDTNNLIIGNYLTGVSRWTYDYSLPPSGSSMIASQPATYVAYFTGGDRVYECSVPWNTNPGVCPTPLNYLLNNNAQGRFRLEIEIKVTGDGNRSPIVTQIPIMPVMHVAHPNYARFQIAAYDLDPVDNRNLQFRFGNTREMGGIMRSKADGVVNSAAYYGNFDCNQAMYEEDRDGDGQPDNKCPDDRTPVQTPQAGNSAPEQKLRAGLYNMVVMVSDGKVKVPLDFMLYLYDGNLNFCNENCLSNVAGTPTFANSDGIYGTQHCTICGLGDGDFTLCQPDSENLGSGNSTCGEVSSC
eukprot:jgi/Chlat1/1835/Chrsp14S00120